VIVCISAGWKYSKKYRKNIFKIMDNNIFFKRSTFKFWKISEEEKSWGSYDPRGRWDS